MHAHATQSRQDLVVMGYPLARAIARSVHKRLPGEVELDDLVSAAVLGLMDAAERYDGARATSFPTFARHRIYGAVVDALREADWVPRTVRRRADRIERARDRLRDELGRDPEPEEIARALDTDVAGLAHLRAHADTRGLLSLDAPTTEDGAPLADAIADVSHDAVLGSEREELRERVRAELAGLPERERVAVGLYYFEELSLKEIGQVLGVTESRACQLCKQGLGRLRIRLQDAVA